MLTARKKPFTGKAENATLHPTVCVTSWHMDVKRSANHETSPAPCARLSCRVSVHIKRQAEQAAAFLGQSISDCTEAALAGRAQIVMDRQMRITLSEGDFARFVASLDHPEAPTESLRRALRDYRQLQGSVL